MSGRPTIAEEDELKLATEPLVRRSYALGALAALGVALVYGLCAEVLGLSWGLVAVGFVGGMAIGGAMTRGAWQGRPHSTVRRLQVAAALTAVASWVMGVLAAYVISQALLPQASTPLLERLSVEHFSLYFGGLDPSIRFIHGASLAAMAFMAWRGAR